MEKLEFVRHLKNTDVILPEKEADTKCGTILKMVKQALFHDIQLSNGFFV